MEVYYNESTSTFEALWKCMVSSQMHKQHPNPEQRKEEELRYILLW